MQIKVTPAYIEWKAYTYRPNSVTFTKADDPDLFYALHIVNIERASGNNTVVTDTFDFAYDNDYDDLFTTLVNNYAALAQSKNILKPISIKITFTY